MKAKVLITTHSQAPHGQVPQPPAFFVYSTPAIQASLQLGGTKTKNWGEDSLQLGALKLIRVTLSGNLFSNLLSYTNTYLLRKFCFGNLGRFPWQSITGILMSLMPLNLQ